MTSPEDNRPSVQASLIDYKGRTMIRLEFKYDIAIIAEVKAIRGRVWSTTNRCWFVPNTVDNQRRFGLSEFDQSPAIVGEGPSEVSYKSIC